MTRTASGRALFVAVPSCVIDNTLRHRSRGRREEQEEVMSGLMKEIDERTNLTNNNQFELLLFRLGNAERSGQNEIFGINVFKVREILVMPKITTVVGGAPAMLGMADIRGQVIPVIDLAKIVGCTPQGGSCGILLALELLLDARLHAGDTTFPLDESGHHLVTLADGIVERRPAKPIDGREVHTRLLREPGGGLETGI